ncbi:hypothetical protein M0812_08154 [Anaeramoeba flamelloides]|uniref:Uncharacterized protein n=1 Tax=Anaeramoeba flamelloides TaxID=1746091 RepID=A0AAV7ZZ22_9EUKA|nr:hypothetical protein M0812_08154 [Anaeramoeba flamelloides]
MIRIPMLDEINLFIFLIWGTLLLVLLFCFLNNRYDFFKKTRIEKLRKFNQKESSILVKIVAGLITIGIFFSLLLLSAQDHMKPISNIACIIFVFTCYFLFVDKNTFSEIFPKMHNYLAYEKINYKSPKQDQIIKNPLDNKSSHNFLQEDGIFDDSKTLESPQTSEQDDKLNKINPNKNIKLKRFYIIMSVIVAISICSSIFFAGTCFEYRTEGCVSTRFTRKFLPDTCPKSNIFLFFFKH